MQSTVGVITLVQESRFQLVDDHGIAHLFILGHAAAAEPAQLVALAQQQSRVRVFFAPAGNVIGRTALRIECLEPARMLAHERPSSGAGPSPVEP